jgi:hypothetical protein
MSSLRGLGAGISKFFQTASLVGSRAPSLTPPPSELTTTSVVAPLGPPPGGQAWTTSAGGAAPLAAGGSGSGGGAAASVPPSLSASVLGASPATLAARMRLMRQPLPAALQLGPITMPPPEMLAVRTSGSSEPGSSSGAGAPPAAPAAALGAGPPAPPAAGTPHSYHHRVAHMRTITEENLDALLRPGSSGGVDLLGGGLASAAAAAAALRASGLDAGTGAPSNLGRAEVLVMEQAAADQGDGGIAAPPGVPMGAGAGASPDPAHVSPFANCAEGASGPPRGASERDAASHGSAAGSVGVAAPLASCSWAGSAPLAAAGAGAAGARYPSSSAAAPEDLRLVLHSPRRVSSAGVSDGAAAATAAADVDAADGLDAWPTDAAHGMGGCREAHCATGNGQGRRAAVAHVAAPGSACVRPFPGYSRAGARAPLAPRPHHLLRPNRCRGRAPRGVSLVEGVARGVPPKGRQRVRLGPRRL